MFATNFRPPKNCLLPSGFLHFPNLLRFQIPPSLLGEFLLLWVTWTQDSCYCYKVSYLQWSER